MTEGDRFWGGKRNFRYNELEDEKGGALVRNFKENSGALLGDEITVQNVIDGLFFFLTVI